MIILIKICCAYIFLSCLVKFILLRFYKDQYNNLSNPGYLYYMVTESLGAHVRSNLCYLICLRHLIRSRVVTDKFFFSEKSYFSSCVRSNLKVTILYKNHGRIVLQTNTNACFSTFKLMNLSEGNYLHR